MAGKRKISAPPPSSLSHSSDEDSSSEEEQDVVQSRAPLAPTPKRTESESGSESESESESESGPDPPLASQQTPLKPSKSESSSSDSDEEDEEVKSPVKESESKPDNKKPKLSDPDQSLSKKPASAFARIWSEEDEMALLRAMFEYKASKGQIPQMRDYTSFLPTITGSISFPVTLKQLANKIRQFKLAYDKKVMRGSDVNDFKPHEKAVFEMCAKLYEKGRTSKASEKVKLDNGDVANGGAANGHLMSASANGAVMAGSNFYLRGSIEELINERHCSGWNLTVDEVIAQIGKTKAKDLEERIKMLRIDMLKLHARENGLKAELLGILADDMEAN